MSYKFLNVHPKGKSVNDCVKRAFTIATKKDYMIIQKELNQIKREIGASSYRDNDVWKKYVSNDNWKKLSFPAKKGESRMNGKRFTEQYPKGTYILNMAHHLSVCVDGVIYDTWDCREKCVYNAFELTNKKKEEKEEYTSWKEFLC